MSQRTQQTTEAAKVALELALRNASDEEARQRLQDLLPSPRDLGDVRRRIRADEDAGPEVRRTALRYIYVVSRDARRQLRETSTIGLAQAAD